MPFLTEAPHSAGGIPQSFKEWLTEVTQPATSGEVWGDWRKGTGDGKNIPSNPSGCIY